MKQQSVYHERSEGPVRVTIYKVNVNMNLSDPFRMNKCAFSEGQMAPVKCREEVR